MITDLIPHAIKAKFTPISHSVFKTKPRRCFGYWNMGMCKCDFVWRTTRFSWCSWRFGWERAIWGWFVHIPDSRHKCGVNVSKVSRCFCLLSQSGCSFGGRFYSLEDTWHPDLGEPFGVMHCVMCHCEPVSCAQFSLKSILNLNWLLLLSCNIHTISKLNSY